MPACEGMMSSNSKINLSWDPLKWNSNMTNFLQIIYTLIHTHFSSQSSASRYQCIHLNESTINWSNQEYERSHKRTLTIDFCEVGVSITDHYIQFSAIWLLAHYPIFTCCPHQTFRIMFYATAQQPLNRKQALKMEFLPNININSLWQTLKDLGRVAISKVTRVTRVNKVVSSCMRDRVEASNFLPTITLKSSIHAAAWKIFFIT